MATVVTCDFCEIGPEQATAAWTISAQTLKDSTICTIKARDVCPRHVGEAAVWASEFASTENFCQIVIRLIGSDS